MESPTYSKSSRPFSFADVGNLNVKHTSSKSRKPFKSLFNANVPPESRHNERIKHARNISENMPLARPSTPFHSNDEALKCPGEKDPDFPRDNTLDSATAELTRGYEERLAHFESKYTQISLDLDDSREALARERRRWTETRRRSMPVHSDLGAQFWSTYQAQSDAEHSAAAERLEYIVALKAVQGQNASLSRALRERDVQNIALVAELKEECAIRRSLESDLACVFSMDLTGLINRRTSQTESSGHFQGTSVSATGECYTSHWTGAVEEIILENSTNPPPSSHDVNSRVLMHESLGALTEELRVTKDKLAASEEICNGLTQKISSLKQTIVTCADQSASALQVERELRFEVEARVLELLVENREIKEEKEGMEKELGLARPIVQAWQKNLAMFEQIEEMAATATFKHQRDSEPADGGLTFSEEQPDASPQLQELIKNLREKLALQEMRFKMKEKELRTDMKMRASASLRLLRKRRSKPSTQADGEWSKVVRGLVRSSQFALLGKLTSQFLGATKPSTSQNASNPSTASFTRSFSRTVKRYLKVDPGSAYLADTTVRTRDCQIL